MSYKINDILNNIELLKLNVEALLEQTDFDNKSQKNIIYYNTIPDDLDFFFFMVYFHKTDYETYLLIDNWIMVSLKKQVKLQKLEIKKYKALKEETEIKLKEIDNNSEMKRSEKYFFRSDLENKLSGYIYIIEKKEKDILKLQDCIINHKIYKKEENILKEEYIPLYKKWFKLKYAEMDFNTSINNEKEDMTDLKNKIKLQKEEMQEFINKYNQ